MPHHRWTVPLAGALALCAIGGQAEAHPHVFVDAKMEIVGGPDGTLGSIRNIWRFDELFSSSVLFDFDKNKNGELDPDELDEVGKTVLGSIAEWSYYTFVSVKAGDLAFNPPPEIRALYQDGQLLLFFEMKPKQTVDLKSTPVTFTVYDESFFVAFDFADENAFQLLDLPKTCTKAFTQPNPDEDAADWMNSISMLKPDQKVPDDGVDFAAVMATRVDVKCAG